LKTNKRTVLLRNAFPHFDATLISLELKGDRKATEKFTSLYGTKSEDGSVFRYGVTFDPEPSYVICFLPSKARVEEVYAKAKELGLSRGNLPKKLVEVIVSCG
jgi:hypothetical protein